MPRILRWLQRKFAQNLPYYDRFIVRLPSATIGCGMLDPGNIYLMDYALKNVPEGKNIVEIGSWGGLSANLLLHLMQKYHRKERFLGCDPWMYGYDEQAEGFGFFIDGRDDISRAEYMAYIKQSFISSVSLFHKSNLPFTFQLKSDVFFENFDKKTPVTDVFGRTTTLEGSISFCYIDGNHSYEFAKRDFENTDQHLIVNGMILFDDSYDGSGFGSTALMKEMKRNPKYRLVAKNPNYLFQKIA